MTKHLVIPDTQVKPGVPTDHLRWIGQYAATKKPDVIVQLGDHWDFPSLSSYDRGKKAMEGRRVDADIEAGNEAFRKLDAPIAHEEERTARRGTPWTPRKVHLRGNHEHRLQRAIEDDARMEGVLTFDDLDTCGWEVHDFLEVEWIDGIAYSHYFYNPNTGRPYAGANVETRLKTIGYSFTMGHQQGLKQANMPTIGGMKRGLVAGTCYLHDEEYLGPQGNKEWRGIVMCNEVADGDYSIMEVTLDFLCRKYEGVPLKEFMSTNYPTLEVNL